MVHKEGKIFLTLVFIVLLVFNYFFYSIILLIASCILFAFFLSFFRNPRRIIMNTNDNLIYAPADGKLVVIEETIEEEYLKTKCMQVSIFMSVWNVHINWIPVNGVVKYYKYHKGKYLVARHPKSSIENERTTIVIQTNNKIDLVLRQIAGFVARRVVSYAKEEQIVSQGEQLGFIKFGSRVDLFLPLDAKIKVKLNEKVKGNKTIIAEL